MTLHPNTVARFRAGESTPAFNGFYFAAVSDSGLAAHPSIYYSYEVYFEGWVIWLVFMKYPPYPNNVYFDLSQNFLTFIIIILLSIPKLCIYKYVKLFEMTISTVG